MNQIDNFNIIENPEPEYNREQVIHDYTQTKLTIKQIQKKHNITNGQWQNIVKHFKKEGIPLRKSGRVKQ